MRRLLPGLWAGTALLAAALTCGCQHNCCCCSRCHTATTAQQHVANSPAVSTAAPIVHIAAKIPPANPVQSADAPPPAQYGHDPNYHWLVGTLEYSRIQEAWLLRYVSYEEDDRYGGCVALVGITDAKSLKPGQIVRVEGSLIDPESRHLRPDFEVRTIRLVGS